MDWRLLFKGLGIIWLSGCAFLAYVMKVYGTDPQPFQMMSIGAGVLGFAIFSVVSASCPKKENK